MIIALAPRPGLTAEERRAIRLAIDFERRKASKLISARQLADCEAVLSVLADGKQRTTEEVHAAIRATGAKTGRDRNLRALQLLSTYGKVIERHSRGGQRATAWRLVRSTDYPAGAELPGSASQPSEPAPAGSWRSEGNVRSGS